MVVSVLSAPWSAHYDPGVPATLAPYPTRTLLDYVSDVAREHPNRPALIFKGTRITYAELERLSDQCAAALQSMGVAQGDRVALLLPNSPQFLIAQFAAWKLGAIVAPLNPVYPDSEIEAALREHGVETVIVLTRYYPRVKKFQHATPVRRVITTNIKHFFPPLLNVLFTIFREKHDGDRIRLQRGDHDLLTLIRRHAGIRPTRIPLSPDDPAVLLMSGGTTGTAKGVIARHASYAITGLQIAAWFGSVLEPGKDVVLLALPLFHVYANVGVQPMAFVTGSTLVLVPNPRDVDDLVATIQKTRPTFFPSVPTLFIALLKHPAVKHGRVDFRSIKACFSGAAALMAETKQRFEALTGGRIVEGYSLTEAMMALCVNPLRGENKIGSVGMPLPDVHVRIFDGDEGVNVMPAGEVGEICVSAPQLMIGYWNRPEETSGMLRDHVDSDGTTRRWLHTGDLGYLDDDGYLFIVDRKKDLIKAGGFQVWPREVEEVIATHPAVAEVGVAGVMTENKGEAVKAWVVLHAGQVLSEHDLRAYCGERLAPYKVPSQIEFRTELPKTLVGKVLRRALREGH